MWTLESFPGHEAKTRYEGVVPGDGANDLIRVDRPHKRKGLFPSRDVLPSFFGERYRRDKEPVKVSLRLATLDYDRTMTLLLKLLRYEATGTIEAKPRPLATHA